MRTTRRFFEVRFEPDPPAEPGWHEVRIEVVESIASAHVGPVTGEVHVTAPDADFLVVSDLDDTVVRTGATSRLSMFRTVLMNDAHSRVPFQGVRSFYHALAAGPSGAGDNPFFYVSRSAWNVYDMLAGFLDHHGLPKGPLLLKDYGTHSLLGYDEEEHKRGAIDDLLEFYPGIPLLLIGDSGQRDPEIYRSIALDRPGRVRAIIIRDVTTPERDREVHRIAEEVRAAGVPMFLAEESAEAALEAAEAGLLAEDRLSGIEAERESDELIPSLLARMLSGFGLRSRSAH